MAPAALSGSPPKPMRKGTKSCRRRRKIKCIYAEISDSRCKPCQKHDRPCQRQGYVVDRTLKAHLSRVETATEKFGRNHVRFLSDSDASTSESEKGGSSASSLLSSASSVAEPNSSFLKLFHTTITPSPGDHVMDLNNTQENPAARSDHTLQDVSMLLSTIESEPQVLSLLQNTSSWWMGWRKSHWKLRKNAQGQALADFVKDQLMTKEPVSVGMALLCLAMSLLLVRPGIDDVGVRLTIPIKALGDKILTAVDDVVLKSDEHLWNEDVVLLLLLKAKYHAENSQSYQATTDMQRALRIAQLQRLGVAGAPGANTEDIQAQQQFLGAIYEVERFTCMVFGFPYLADAKFSDSLALQVLYAKESDAMLRMRAFRRVVAIAAQRISDRDVVRNQINHNVTDEVEHTLDTARAQMPTEWWNVDTSLCVEDPSETFEIMMTQLWFWTVKMFLYLPYTWNATSISSLQMLPRRDLCLEAARHLISDFVALRSAPSLSILVCNCDDFMGIIAAATLVVATMQQTSPASTPEIILGFSEQQFKQDMTLIENLKDVYSYRADEQGGAIAKQGLQALQALTSFFEENTLIDESSTTRTSGGDKVQTASIMLPYFGRINIQAPEKFVRPSSVAAQSPEPNQAMTSVNVFSDGHVSFDGVSDVVQWEDWNQFAFGSELNQDWNLNLDEFNFVVET